MLQRLCLALALLAAGVVPALAEPALWKVSGPKADVYLFGTVHVLHKADDWRAPKVVKAFEGATDTWFEIIDGDDPASLRPLIIRFGIDREKNLSDKLDEPTRVKLVKVEGEYGLPANAIEPLQPWFAALNLSLAPLAKAGYDPKSGVDLNLRKEATAKGKRLHAFETAESQLHLFADLPQAVQVDLLRSTLEDDEKGAALLDGIVTAWLAGDVDRISALMDDDMKTAHPLLYRHLMVERNQAFAKRIAEVLKSGAPGPVFVAVGAGHLAGPDSVQVELARLGFKAVRQ